MVFVFGNIGPFGGHRASCLGSAPSSGALPRFNAVPPAVPTRRSSGLATSALRAAFARRLALR